MDIYSEDDIAPQEGIVVENKPAGKADNLRSHDPAPSKPTKKEKKALKPALPAHGKFKKIKGSNPQEVRRQFLEHNMLISGVSNDPSSTLNPAKSTKSTGKLRTGREVLNRMRFDAGYDIGDYVVGYIDRKEGILEKSIEEWDKFGQGQEELMAYVRCLRSTVIVWDRARRIDLVFGES